MSMQARILATYGDLVTRPGGTITLAELRAHLADLDRTTLDDTLLDMDERRVIQLEPDPYRLGLTAQDHAASIRLGGRDMHLMRKVER